MQHTVIDSIFRLHGELYSEKYSDTLVECMECLNEYAQKKKKKQKKKENIIVTSTKLLDTEYEFYGFNDNITIEIIN